jgi:purine-binding chemotaxis protein CheW
VTEIVDADCSQGVGGYVMFRLGDQEFAAALAGVREVLRLDGLTVLPGMAASMAGVIDLRGTPLPVMDLRSVPGERGDVLVLADDDDLIGVAVDGVVAVLSSDDLLASADGSVPAGLPAYVVEVLRDAVADTPVLLVDLRRMLDLVSA